jgi:hypothetical protein
MLAMRAISPQRLMSDAGDRFLRRDFFALGKEVSSGIWLRPEAALVILNTLFHRMAFYPLPGKATIA